MLMATAATRSSGAQRLSTMTGACSTARASATATPSTWPTTTPTDRDWRCFRCTRRKAPTPGTCTTPPRARYCSRVARRALTTAAALPASLEPTCGARCSGVPTKWHAAPSTVKLYQTRSVRTTSASSGTATCRRNCSTATRLTSGAKLPSQGSSRLPTTAPAAPVTARRTRPVSRPTSWATGAKR